MRQSILLELIHEDYSYPRSLIPLRLIPARAQQHVIRCYSEVQYIR
jgi:hypothetical protein